MIQIKANKKIIKNNKKIINLVIKMLQPLANQPVAFLLKNNKNRKNE